MSLLDKAVVWTLPFVPKLLVKKASSKYIAGDSLDDAIQVVKKLNREGCCTTLDVLGEFITKKEEANTALNDYLAALEHIHTEKVDCNISVKLSMFALQLDAEYCYDMIRKLVQRAKELDIFVRLDMEDSPSTTATLKTYSRLRSEFDNVGFVIQAYMRRSLKDIHQMMREHGQVNVRLCKGIYIEPREIAYKNMALINSNYTLLLEELLKNKSYVGIATHDEKLVWEACRIINELKLKPNQFEFQMLYGVDEQLRRIIVKEGYKLRVYVPFGQKWYEYSTRRLKENPAIALHVIKGMLNLK